MDEAEAVRVAADVLYATDPARFMELRAELVARARTEGDAAAAKQIGALRKPTVAAWIVNVQAREDPDAVARLLDLNGRLRAAHEDLDATALRDLSGERRALVGRLARDALSTSGREDATVTLRDEVVATFDAAVADPQIAARLGRLQRAEHWSGFGVAASPAPALTLVQGGRSRPAAAPERPKRPSRQAQRSLTKAQEAFDKAESDLASAHRDEEAGQVRVEQLVEEAARVKGELDEARADLERIRRTAKAARTRRREARSALDRAERNAAT